MRDGMGVLLDASTEGKLSELVAATTQRIRVAWASIKGLRG
jgi:hypothetical protein